MFVAVRTEWMWHYLLAVVVLIDIIAASDVKRLDGKEEVIGVNAEQIMLDYGCSPTCWDPQEYQRRML